ncbi:MAG: hypothetical protein GX660_01050 [Clostridiaceae bacterium]|nr:hypothetical protein [Clostridiaceae bacterium]
MPFTIEELTFLDIYKAPTIQDTKNEIQKVLPLIDDADMLVLAESVLLKLDTITSEEFDSLDFTNSLSSENISFEDT